MEHHHDHDMPGGHDMNQCNMNMLFTWSYENLCIVFPSWHINSLPRFLFSLFAIVIMTAGYEAVREISRRVESGSTQPLALRDDARGRGDRPEVAGAAGSVRRGKGVRGLLYAVQVFYSFFIMLLFMTYNGWVMLAVAAGAFVGYMLFGTGSATKTVACH